MMIEQPTSRDSPAPTVRIENVSRWYGEILGVNKVTVDISPGITGLVGPNGSGKSTLMNIICGLMRPGQGSVTVLGQPVWNNAEIRRLVGYCTQVDHFYETFTGQQFLFSLLQLHGRGARWSEESAEKALAIVGMTEHRHRVIAGYSKGMRQRVKVALALAHSPEVVVLDEPFNGLDPVGRREMMQLLTDYAREGRTVILSSHILHEVERMTNRVLMMSNGYVLAEGEVMQVRDLLRRHPFKVFVRCDQPRRLAGVMLEQDGVLRVEIQDDNSITLSTTDPDNFYLKLNDLVLNDGFEVDVVTLADENMQSIFQYLSGREHH